MDQNITNSSLIDEKSPYNSHGAMIYIIGVLSWYAIGFILILIKTICSKQDLRKTSGSNILSDLHEYQTRNNLLIELKDEDQRKKLWEIYYGTHLNLTINMNKDKQILLSKTKQLNDESNIFDDHYH